MSRMARAMLDRFNTWDSDHPAELTLPSFGLRMGFAAYSNRDGRFTRFQAPLDGVRLGPRAIDGRLIELEVTLAGTRLALAFQRHGDRTVTGRWEALEHGEWGLRFWPIVWLEWRPPEADGRPVEWTLDDDTGAAHASDDRAHACAMLERPPLLATFHASAEALGHELDSYGYWFLESRGTRGDVAALRCNLEEMPALAFSLAVRESRESASLAASEALTRPQPVPSVHTGANAGALDAVRDVMGWNTVYDAVNQRRYTGLSRNWTATKFGSFGVWLDDQLYYVLMAGLFDPELALDNLRAVVSHATEAGNLPCLVTGRDAWVDRSQPPIGAFVAWMVYLRWHDRSVLECCYDALLANHEWWWRTRDGNGNGLLEYGTSPVGDGLYRGTKLAAKDESSMDNSPVHDETTLVASTGTLDCEDVGLNSLLALDGEMLAHMARELGHSDTAIHLDRRTAELKHKIATELWDANRDVFANRLWSGSFVTSIAPTSFYPLIAGAATSAQAQALLGWLEREDAFGGEHVLPSVARADRAYADNVYWRGRVWPPLNLLTYYGLRRYGFDTQADHLARKSLALFDREWKTDRVCAENYSAETGAARDQPDTDTFYGWGALMPWLGVATLFDVTPWGGFEIRFDGRELALGPVQSPFGEAGLRCQHGTLSLSLDGVERLRTDAPGRIRVAEVSDDGLACEVACAASALERTVVLPGLSPSVNVRARADGKPISLTRQGRELTMRVPAGTRVVEIRAPVTD